MQEQVKSARCRSEANEDALASLSGHCPRLSSFGFSYGIRAESPNTVICNIRCGFSAAGMGGGERGGVGLTSFWDEAAGLGGMGLGGFLGITSHAQRCRWAVRGWHGGVWDVTWGRWGWHCWRSGAGIGRGVLQRGWWFLPSMGVRGRGRGTGCIGQYAGRRLWAG